MPLCLPFTWVLESPCDHSHYCPSSSLANSSSSGSWLENPLQLGSDGAYLWSQHLGGRRRWISESWVWDQPGFATIFPLSKAIIRTAEHVLRFSGCRSFMFCPFLSAWLWAKHFIFPCFSCIIYNTGNVLDPIHKVITFKWQQEAWNKPSDRRKHSDMSYFTERCIRPPPNARSDKWSSP